MAKAGLILLLLLWTPFQAARAETTPLFKDPSAMEAPTRQELRIYTDEEPESLPEFFKRRTQLGVGFDEEYNTNIRLEDNKKRDDWISTLESLLLFNDPRGSILYGTRWEVNAFRYHHSNENAIDHDFLAYFDLDPGGRIQFHAEYGLQQSPYLVFGGEKIDVLRRSTDFQYLVKTAWRGRAKYALNKTNNLVPQITYAILDDQSATDTSSDRKQLDFILDMDHDLTPTWVLFSGYALTDTSLPKKPANDSQSHGGRLGLRHTVTETADLDLTLTLKRTTFQSGQTSTDLGEKLLWIYQAGPRTKLQVSYSDSKSTSFSTARRQFRSQSPSVQIQYEWTPLVNLAGSVGYNRQTSSSQQVAAGTAPIHSEIQTSYSLGTGLEWKFTENGHVTADYSYHRSKSRDTTRQRVVVGFEISF